jgi:hypothetical protein
MHPGFSYVSVYERVEGRKTAGYIGTGAGGAQILMMST